MFGGLFGGVKKNPELEHLIERMENNMANNYKDAAQEYLVESPLSRSLLPSL